MRLDEWDAGRSVAIDLAGDLDFTLGAAHPIPVCGRAIIALAEPVAAAGCAGLVSQPKWRNVPGDARRPVRQPVPAL